MRYLLLTILGLLAACSSPLDISVEQHQQEVSDWQQRRAAGLLREDGWLSLIGLCWFAQPQTTFGSGETADCRIDNPKLPAIAGVFHRDEQGITFTVGENVIATESARAISEVRMQSDASEHPTIIAIDSIRFYVIERAGNLGLRIRDLESPARENFSGLEYFPIDLDWRKIARFEAHATPKPVRIINILGMEDEMASPGELVFEHDGREYRLTAIAEEGDDSWFIMLADATSGKSTYGAGRYIYVDPPVDGETVLDFNKVYNPPCAFTALATCPLPPVRNRLSLEITAGEKTYASDAAWQMPDDNATH